ncbi:MAG: MFS transporter [Actinobacteria bacterium]|jgi:MFS family permease|nr:MFS transporter [Actinomycetota bacterium]NDI11153.1 MFS transporter [Actinomycetota bacterium]
MANLAIDFSPLKKYPDFRRLWLSGLISYFGSMFTYVALPFQVKELTGSYLAVGLIGLVEIIPLVVFGLYGGVLADHMDRKKMIWVTEFAALFLSLILLINSLLPSPSLALIYIVAALFSAVDGLQRPSADAILPRLVEHNDLPAASALMSLRWQVGMIAGPSLAGVLISIAGVSAGFILDIVTYFLSLIILIKVKSVPPIEISENPSFSSLVAGVKYATSRKDLMGTYLVDLSAMFFAMPTALFPFWAEQVGAPWALGLFYAAGTIGSILVTVTSGWVKNYTKHGRAIFLAALGWGVAITFAGLVNNLALILLFLILAGASDMVSALFRSTLWNQSIPDEFRGRLAGVELISYSVGPLGGQTRAGFTAERTSLRTSVVSGGLLCIGFVAFFTALLPDFRKYDSKSNKFAVSEAKKRKTAPNN